MLRTIEDQTTFHGLTQEIFFLKIDAKVLEIDVLDTMGINLIRFGNQIIADFENWIDEDQQRLEEMVLDDAIYGFLHYLANTEFGNEEIIDRVKELAEKVCWDLLSQWEPIARGIRIKGPWKIKKYREPPRLIR